MWVANHTRHDLLAKATTIPLRRKLQAGNTAAAAAAKLLPVRSYLRDTTDKKMSLTVYYRLSE